jgi:hypothetical protein
MPPPSCDSRRTTGAGSPYARWAADDIAVYTKSEARPPPFGAGDRPVGAPDTRAIRYSGGRGTPQAWTAASCSVMLGLRLTNQPGPGAGRLAFVSYA